MTSAKIVRRVIYGINVVTGIYSIVLLTGGSILLSLNANTLGSIIVTVALLSFILSILACLTVEKSNKYLFYAFSCGTLVLGIMLLILLVFEFIWQANGEIESLIKTRFQDYWNDQNNKQKKEIIEHLQELMNCCGNEGPLDYSERGLKPLESCYDDNEINEDGCAKVVRNLVFYTIGLSISSIFPLLFLTLVLIDSLEITPDSEDL